MKKKVYEYTQRERTSFICVRNYRMMQPFPLFAGLTLSLSYHLIPYFFEYLFYLSFL